MALRRTLAPADIGAHAPIPGARLAQTPRSVLRAPPGGSRAAACRHPGDLGGQQALGDLGRLVEQGGGAVRRRAARPSQPRRRRSRLRGDRLLHTGRAARQPGGFIDAEALGRQQAGQPTQMGSRKTRIVVRRIVGERRAATPGKRRSRSALRRPSSGRASVRLSCAAASSMPRRPAIPRAAQQTEDHRLGLIVGVMGGDHDVGADPPGAGAQQAIAGLARPLLQTAARLGGRPIR